MTADSTALFNIQAFFRTGPIRWLVVGGAFLIAAITIGTTIMADNFRERALFSADLPGQGHTQVDAGGNDSADSLPLRHFAGCDRSAWTVFDRAWRNQSYVAG